MTKMNTALYTLLLVMSCIYDTIQRSTVDSPSYVASVVEFSPEDRIDGGLTLMSNAYAYVQFIWEAGFKGADIIVFPESGLSTSSMPARKDLKSWTSFVPDANERYSPCTNENVEMHSALKMVSCAANSTKMYVVINIGERVPCEEDGCPSDKLLYYNTNVVFDRDGIIIAKYRKTHLFGEYAFNVTKTPEIITFDTDFGVTFGTLICFDILFSVPGLTLTRELGVKDIIFTSAWFSQSPFLTAVEVQHGWAFSEDVNLLASGYNNPIGGSGGSGIFLGRQGVGIAVMPFDQESKLLTYVVPKKTNSTISTKQTRAPTLERSQRIEKNLKVSEKSEVSIDMTNTYTVGNLTLIYDNLQNYTKEILTESVTNKTLCHDNFCCNFFVSMNDNDPSVTYYLTVFEGIRVHLETIMAPTRLCGVVQCANKSSSSCSQSRNTSTSFNSISITATFKNFDKFLIMPMTLNTAILPIDNFLHEEHSHGNDKNITISLNTKTENLVSFAFYARYYGSNDPELENSADIGCLSPLLPLVILLYLTIMG
ncbi:vanin-like protein 1 [Cephus cinctus]|uniref:Vanin-like protein 1 n=1 Tax=Cephus cinctus TaxID=211228 RepID=A0AAJ7VXJ2_CEPCN|nr:vanin-like protein 1 [Cephus cinctus]XP_024936786.1 vanin-like protein 1 [Cephus cinctus]XP_024936787.1 vanin-like protein 1 [Cephus cinctus]